MISIRAKKSKPAYKEKKETESGGYVWVYDEKHIKKRWQEKRDKIKKLKNSISSVREQYKKDLSSEDQEVRAIAAIVGIMDETSARIGNEASVEEFGTYGASTLKVKHVSFSGSKAKFKFLGKKKVKQNIEVSNSKLISVIKELTKGKGPGDFIFEIEGKKLRDRSVNKYLSQFDISAKDIRGFHANEIMKKKLKTKEFDVALVETAEEVGHEPSTLKNQYLLPELVDKYKKASIDIRAGWTEDEVRQWVQMMRRELAGDIAKQPGGFKLGPRREPDGKIEVSESGRNRISTRVRLTNIIYDAWRMILPFLPPGTRMTSGLRTRDDQVRIVAYLWNKHTGSRLPRRPNFNEIVRRLRADYGVIVAAPGRSPHHDGRAFDLSGANFGAIERVLQELSGDPDFPVKFSKILIENANNAVHVEVESVTYDWAALNRRYHRAKTAAASIVAAPIRGDMWKHDPNPHRIYKDFRAPPETIEALYSGVHVSDDKELAMVYANNKASEADPPAILEVETSNLKSGVDIDAENVIGQVTYIYKDVYENASNDTKEKIGAYRSLARSAHKELPQNLVSALAEQIRRDIEDAMDYFESQFEPSGAQELIVSETSRLVPSAISSYYQDDVKLVDAFADIVFDKKVDPAFASYVVNQYRYLEDIEDHRILSLSVFDMFDSDEIDYDDDLEAETEEGERRKLSYEDIMYGNIAGALNYRTIWRNPRVSGDGSRVQYHGTTLSRAKQILSKVMEAAG